MQKTLTTFTLVIFAWTATAPLAFGQPKPIQFTELTIDPVQLTVDSSDTSQLGLVKALNLSADIAVPAGGNFQSALNAAQPNDTITLQAGATFTDNFRLPVKSGTGYITVRSSRCSEIPTGQQITAAQEALTAYLLTPNVAPVLTAPINSHHFRFECITFTQSPALPVDNNPSVGYAWSYNLIELGESAQTNPESIAHHLEFDRVIVRTRDDATMSQRGITANSGFTSVTNSRIVDIKWPGTETQAIGGWNGPGPFLIENNFLESAGINILFGGAKPSVPNLVPSDITIRNNTLFKRPEWKGRLVRSPDGRSSTLNIKNFLELKNARRATITNNLMENNWPDGQVGWAVIFNTFHDGWWEVVDDIQFVRNTIRNSTNGINLAGMDTRDGDTTVRMHRIMVADNRLEGLGFGGFEAKPFQLLNASEDVTIEHNTVTTSTHSLVLDSAPGFGHVRLRYRNNLTPHGDYGVFSNGGKLGVEAMNERATDWQMEKNALIAAPDFVQAKYPGNYFPATAADATGLLGTDGIQVGVRSGTSIPVPSPSPSPVVSPSPSPSPTAVPSPTVLPTPQPSPSAEPSPDPTPEGTPFPCTLDAPASISVPPNGTGKIGVSLNSMTPQIDQFLIRVTSSTPGQVSIISENPVAVTGTSAVVEFGVRVKKRSAIITFTSPCPTKTTVVMVQ